MFKKINQIVNSLQKLEKHLLPKKRTRQFLVSYQWANDISAASGESSLIVTLKPEEKMDADMIKDLQRVILDKISTAGHVNDPTNVTVTGFFELEK